jgi:hypothetical protein
MVLLRTPLYFLDDGSATGTITSRYVPDMEAGIPEGDTLFDVTKIKSSCDFDLKQQTSINGTCASAFVDSSKLPDYSDALVFGPGGSSTSPTCFDVQRCMQAATPAPSPNQQNGCSVQMPPGADPRKLNFALATSGTGVPVNGVDLVPLESDPGQGWSVQGNVVNLLPGVCAKIAQGARLYVETSGACSAKVQSTPICEKNVPPGAADGGTNPNQDGSVIIAGDGAAPGGDASFGGSSSGASDGGGTFGDSSAGCGTGMMNCGGVCLSTTSDQNNCGLCGRSCLGTTCANGICQATQLGSGTGAFGIAVDTQNVYWANGTQGTVTQAPIAGGATVTVAQAQTTPHAVAVSAVTGTVYWTNFTNTGTVMMAPIGGGTATPIGTTYQLPRSIAVNQQNVYWSLTTGTLLSAPLAGGTVSTIAQGLGNTYDIAIDANNIYALSSTAGVTQRPLAGGTAVTLAPGTGFTVGAAVDSNYLYWSENRAQPQGYIAKAPIGGGTVVTVAQGLNLPGGLAVDASWVYFTSGTNAATIMAVPIGGGTPFTLATNQATPSRIALDNTSVYWTTANGVMKVAKP